MLATLVLHCARREHLCLDYLSIRLSPVYFHSHFYLFSYKSLLMQEYVTTTFSINNFSFRIDDSDKGIIVGPLRQSMFEHPLQIGARRESLVRGTTLCGTTVIDYSKTLS